MSDQNESTQPARPKRRRRLKGVKATPNSCTTGPRAIRVARRRAEALDLRATGLSFREIGKRLGVSTAQASLDVVKGLEEITLEPARELLKLELRRCDELQAAIYPKALKGDATAINSTLRVMWHRGMLMGWTRDLNGAAQVTIRSESGETDRGLSIEFVMSDKRRIANLEAINGPVSSHQRDNHHTHSRDSASGPSPATTAPTRIKYNPIPTSPWIRSSPHISSRSEAGLIGNERPRRVRHRHRGVNPGGRGGGRHAVLDAELKERADRIHGMAFTIRYP